MSSTSEWSRFLNHGFSHVKVNRKRLRGTRMWIFRDSTAERAAERWDEWKPSLGNSKHICICHLLSVSAAKSLLVRSPVPQNGCQDGILCTVTSCTITESDKVAWRSQKYSSSIRRRLQEQSDTLSSSKFDLNKKGVRARTTQKNNTNKTRVYAEGWRHHRGTTDSSVIGFPNFPFPNKWRVDKIVQSAVVRTN